MAVPGVFHRILELPFSLRGVKVNHVKVWGVGFVVLQKHRVTYWNILGTMAMTGIF